VTLAQTRPQPQSPCSNISTALGVGIWTRILALVGCWFRGNQALAITCIHWISMILAIACIALVLDCIGTKRRRSLDHEGK
jgi:membrane protein DedA with SNARE-associated domain